MFKFYLKFSKKIETFHTFARFILHFDNMCFLRSLCSNIYNKIHVLSANATRGGEKKAASVQSELIYSRTRKALNHATPVSSVSLFAPYRFIKILTRKNSDGANGALQGFLRSALLKSARAAEFRTAWNMTNQWRNQQPMKSRVARESIS